MRLPSPLLLLPVTLVCLAPPGEEIAFDLEAGSVVTKTIVDTSTFDLDDLTLSFNGADMSAMLDLEVSVQFEQSVQVTDTYDEVGDGRPLRLTRSFDELSMEVSASATFGGQGDSQDTEAESELEGLTVVFTWDPEDEDYDVEFADDEGDPDLLEDLDADLDLLALLPDEEVSEGDTWEVDLQEIGGLVRPGGDLKLLPRDGAEQAEAFQNALGDGLQKAFAEAFEGTCTCTLVGFVSDEDGRLAEISVEVDASATYDMSEAMLAMIDALSEQTGEQVPDVSIDAADLSLDVTGSGTIFWDLEAGRLRSYETLGDFEFAVDVSMFIDDSSQPVSMEGAAELSGSFTKSFESEE